MMAGIVTEHVPHAHGPNCTHARVKVLLDGAEHLIETSEDEIAAYEFSLQRFVRDAVYYQRVIKGVPLAQLVGRVCLGEEATNVKQFIVLGKDVTKTNIGTAYVNVPIGANGERSLVEFTGCTQFRVVLHANLVGTGPFGFRIVRDGDNAVLFENASVALTGERELDTDWQPLPIAASGLTLVRLQAKSTVAADDPVVRRCLMLVR